MKSIFSKLTGGLVALVIVIAAWSSYGQTATTTKTTTQQTAKQVLDGIYYDAAHNGIPLSMYPPSYLDYLKSLGNSPYPPPAKNTTTTQNGSLQPLGSPLGGQQSGPPMYQLIDIGTSLSNQGYINSIAYDINNVGQVVGDSSENSGYPSYGAFVYQNDSVQILNDLDGNSDDDSVFGINDSGQIVGDAIGTDRKQHAIIYSNGQMQVIDDTESGIAYGSATAINNKGRVVGNLTMSGTFESHMFVYDNGSMQDLGNLGMVGVYADDINDNSIIVGYASGDNYTSYAFSYSGGVVNDINTLGGSSSFALGINNNNQIVGRAYTLNDMAVHGFVYTDGSVLDLGDPIADPDYNDYSEAWGINDNGDVVGYATTDKDAHDNHAFIYTGGTMYDLNKLMLNPESGWMLAQANAINNAGQIVGYETNPQGQYHAFLLNPLPDGSATALETDQTTTPSYGNTPVKNPSDSGLVVITHGWTHTESQSMPTDVPWVDTISNMVVQRLVSDGVSGWQVFGYKWPAASYTVLPDQSLNNAKQQGELLGLSIVAGGWTKVHLIAHSAGAGLIERCSEIIRQYAPNTVIQCTFLDPYMGSDGSGYATYGQAADWSDCYYNRDAETGSKTEGSLANAYNADITQLDDLDRVSVHYYIPGIINSSCYKTVATHFWPVMFYSNTIAGTVTSDYQAFGYTLSQEEGTFNNAKTTYQKGNDPAQVLGTPDPSCSQSFMFAGLDTVSGIQNLLPTVYYSTTGTIDALGNWAYQLFDPPGAPVWLGIVVIPTNSVNVVSFDAKFTSASGSHGLLSVYWDTDVIGLVDEPAVEPGINHYSMAITAAPSTTSHVIGFHLDPFTSAQSSIIVTNIALEANGVTQKPVLSVTTNTLNGSLVYQLTGQPAEYTIQASTNLASTDWQNIAIASATNGVVNFVDTGSTNCPFRFYRAVSQ
ncbi:MAG: DUF3466 family protein [Patescibacteria group bacterium]|nr:DUF3466 family protein [Patescibacteria group bacterium]